MTAQNGNEHAQLILILGGARSGKSSFAERLARKSERSIAFIATAQAGDKDMQARIERHRADRPASWLTIEEPLALALALQQAALSADVILLDCLTLWLSNLLLADGSFADEQFSTKNKIRYQEQALTMIDALLSELAQLAPHKTLIIVTNEVGLGIVPPTLSGLVYRDLLGFVNQRVATAANRVYLMVAGHALDIKLLHNEASI
jgi:adenosylcobinamide kinase/adenosylcobinamide-phosphate guanylyltransferase